MKLSIRHRALAALLAIVGTSFLVGSPAQAITTYEPYGIDTGVLTIDMDGTGTLSPVTFDLSGDDTTHDCDTTPPGPNSLLITTNLGTDTFDANGATFEPFYFNLSTTATTTHFRLSISDAYTSDNTGSPSPGELTQITTTSYNADGYLTLFATITSDANTDCTFDNTFTCELAALLDIDSSTSTYNNDSYTIDVANTLFFATGSCDAPFIVLETDGVGSIEEMVLARFEVLARWDWIDMGPDPDCTATSAGQAPKNTMAEGFSQSWFFATAKGKHTLLLTCEVGRVITSVSCSNGAQDLTNALRMLPIEITLNQPTVNCIWSVT